MKRRLMVNVVSFAGLVFLFFPLLSILIWGLYWMLCGMAFGSEFIKQYGARCLLTADQSLNTIWFGSIDRTISTRAGAGELGWLSRPLCKALDVIDENHCRDSKE